MNRFSNLSRNQIITYTAVLSALGVILNFIELPYFIPYLKIDISEVVVLLATVISLPAAIVVSFIKAFILAIAKDGIDIGTIALFIGSLSLAIPYKLLSNINKDRVFINLLISSLVFTITMVLCNFFFITPIYSGYSLSEAIESYGSLKDYSLNILIMYVPFNLIKGALVSLVFALLYKKLILTEKDEIEIEGLDD